MAQRVPAPETALRSHFAAVRRGIEEIERQEVEALAQRIHQTAIAGGRVYVCGNGGSAATAGHIAADLAKFTHVAGHPRVRTTCLSDNVPQLTAYSNDEGYDRSLVGQLEGLLDARDLVLAISASGNSANILEAVRYAKSQGAFTAALCGFGGGQLAQEADLALVLSLREYGPVEDVHSAVGHALAYRIREIRLTHHA